MAPIIATALAGEPIDALVWRVTGKGSATVDRVIDANRGIAALGAALPEGTTVNIAPAEDAPATLDLVKLWD